MFVRRDLVLFALVGTALGLLTMRSVQPPEPARDSLSVAEAQTLAATGEVTLIDIRRPDEWADTGIPADAHALDMRQPDFLDRLRAIAPSDTPIAVICARGVRSARLAEDMRAAGFTRVLDVPEGMIGSSAGPGWLAEGLPLKSYDGDR